MTTFVNNIQPGTLGYDIPMGQIFTGKVVGYVGNVFFKTLNGIYALRATSDFGPDFVCCTFNDYHPVSKITLE